jgi:hypothetical protein
MSLLSNAAIASIRARLEIVLTHTCTLQRMTSGVKDDEGNRPTTEAGSPEYGVPCTFSTTQQSVRSESGVTLVTVPTLTVSATLNPSIGDEVSAITDQLGGTPPGAAGVFRVERVLDNTAGLGASLLPVFELRGAGAVR